MPISRYFKLYLNAGRSIPLVINANQYDSGETWYFTLYTDTGETYIPSSGAIIGIKSDGHVIDNAATVDSRGRVVVTETEQMTAAAGKAVFEISIDDNSHGSANFIVLVEPKPSDGGILSDSDLSLIQDAIDSTSPAAIAQGVSDWMDENLTPTTPVVDASLTVQGAAADAKKTGDEINDLKSQITGGIPYSVKLALDNILQNVAFKNDDGYSADLSAVHAWATSINVTSISAVYTQSGTVYDTDSLDDLEADLVVTAFYDNGTSAEVSGYTLSGTLEIGTSTIVATYGGKSASFNVTVTDHRHVPTQYTWLYEAKNGELLSAQDYMTYSTAGAGGTETLSDGELVIHTNVQTNSSGTTQSTYKLSDETTTDAILSCRAKPVYLYKELSAYTDQTCGIRMMLSDGSSGAMACVVQQDSSNYISVVYAEGSTLQKVQTSYLSGEYHVFELTLSNGHQSFSIDGEQIFDSTTLSTLWTTANYFISQAGKTDRNPNGVTTNLDWLAYYEVS